MVLIFSVVLAVVKIFKYINKKFNPQQKMVTVFLSVFFAVLGIRENFSGRAINLGGAYSLIKNLKDVKFILNGIFTQIHIYSAA